VVHVLGDGPLTNLMSGQFDTDGRTDLAFTGRGWESGSGVNVRTRLTTWPSKPAGEKPDSGWELKAVFTTDGKDRLDGGPGYDLLWSGGGTDTHVVRLTDSDRVPGFGSGDTVEVPGASVSGYVVSDGVVWTRLTNRELWATGWQRSSNTRTLLGGPDGRAWYLTMDGYLYSWRGDSFWSSESRVVRLHSIDGAGNPVVTRAIPSGWSYQDFRYNPSSDTFWALAGDNLFRDGSSYAMSVWVRLDSVRLDDDFDGAFAGDGEWYVDVSGWRPLNHTSLSEGFYNFGSSNTWSNVTTNSVNFRVQCWEDDESFRLDYTVNMQAALYLFWDSDHSFTWSTWWDLGGGRRNQFNFTFGVHVPSGW
jgi:hypothetical protein